MDSEKVVETGSPTSGSATHALQERYARSPDERLALARSIPFFLMHVAPLFLVFTGVRLVDLAVMLALYVVRMFFITAGYHRYFAHRSYKLGRIMQFLMAFGGSTAAQKGVLWWAGHHRHHHKFSDTDEDVHSPKRGFWWSHAGWILCLKYDETPWARIRDFAKYPELVWLNRFHLVPAALLAVACFAVGGLSMLLCGFFLSTVLLYHGTFTINSLAHVIGKPRYVTSDTSRNSFLLAFITLGEGWHNNHHYYQSSANQGFFWWELDVSFYVLRLLGVLGLVRGIRVPSPSVLSRNLVSAGAATPNPAETVREIEAALLEQGPSTPGA